MKTLTDLNISEIAEVVREDWRDKNGKPIVNFAAEPYLGAMSSLTSIKDMYYQDTGSDVVARFLCNANSWRGEVAKAVKLELKNRLKKA
jgi:hypothetical protein